MLSPRFLRIMACCILAASPLTVHARARIAPTPLASSSRNVEMIVSYDNPEALARLRAMGRVREYHGNVAVVTMSADRMSEAAGCKGVNSIRPQRKMQPRNLRAKNVSKVHDVWNGKDLPQGYDGTGIVMGVYDIGLDPGSPNFNDAEGNTRIKALYRYPEGSSQPECYTTPEEIAEFTTDDTAQSHGTHVLGTMSGSYKHQESKNDYRGAAPGADLIVTTGQGYEGQMLDAVVRVGEYARSVGKPCVMNFSWGDNIGPHDGSDPFTAALNAMAKEYDMLIVCASGNEAGSPISIVKDLTEEDRQVKTFLRAGSESEASQGEGMLQIWADDDTPFSVTIEMVTPGQSGTAPLVSMEMPAGKETYLSAGSRLGWYLGQAIEEVDVMEDPNFNEDYTDSFIGGVMGVSELNGRYCADLYSYLDHTGADDVQTRICVNGTPGQRIFIYTEGATRQTLASLRQEGHDAPDGNGTNSNMGSGPETISVGSFTTDDTYGGSLLYPSAFSSYGPTTDGRFVPDICAPGQVITSSYNRYYEGWGTYPSLTYTDPVTGQDVVYCLMQGTSMAAPHVSGIAALVRQANPELSYAEVKQLLIDTATEPRKDKDNPAWGHGQVNAYNAVKAAVEQSGIRGNAADGRDIMARREADGQWSVTVPAAESFEVAVYDMQGRRVARYNSTGPSLTLNPVERVDAGGVYVMRVEAGQRTASFKILK